MLEKEKGGYKYFNPAVLGLLFAYLLLNYRILLDLFHKWYAQDLSGPYSHGLLVALIVIYMVYKKISSIRRELTPYPSLVGLILLLGLQCVLFVAVLIQVNFVQHIVLVLSLLAITWSAYSYRIAKQFILPGIIFSLAFPVWGGLEFPLQTLSVFTTNAFLSLTQLPYYHEGPFFHFPVGIIEIAPECAGMQQLLVSWILGLLFSVQHHLRTRDIIKTLVYLSLAAVLINTIRIIIIMAVGYYTKMESSLISKHILLGWVIYGVGIYVFMFFYSRVKFKTVPIKTKRDEQESIVSSYRMQPIKIYLVILALVLLPNVSSYAVTRYINNQKPEAIYFKVNSLDWHKKSDQVLIDWKPNFPGADAVSTATYYNKRMNVYVYINNYVHMKPGIEPINMDNAPYNSGIWSIHRQSTLVVRRFDNRRMRLKLDYLHSRSDQRLLVLSYYIVDGKIVDSLVGAKLASLAGILKLDYDIKVVCLAALQGAGANAGLTDLRQFFQALEIH